MGRITDGSYNIYGKGRDQVDIATQNRIANPDGSHTFGGILLSQLIPQLISGGMNILDGAVNSDDESTSTVDSSSSQSVHQYKNEEAKAVIEALDDPKKLDSALEAYYKVHKKGESPTIDNLPQAKKYHSPTVAPTYVRQSGGEGLGFGPRITQQPMV